MDFFAFFLFLSLSFGEIIQLFVCLHGCVHVCMCVYIVYMCACVTVFQSHISFKQNSCKVPQRGHNGRLMEGVGKAEVRSWFLFIYMKACVSASS